MVHNYIDDKLGMCMLLHSSYGKGASFDDSKSKICIVKLSK
jgi:hypothetical protein